MAEPGKGEARLPEVGEFVRGVGRLIEVEVVPPPPPPPPETDYVFEEISAKAEIRLNGRRLQRLGGYHDTSRPESSLTAALGEARRFVESQRIHPESELEVVVIRISTLRRYRPTGDANFYDRSYEGMKALPGFWDTWGLRQPIETVVWTSRNPDAEPQLGEQPEPADHEGGFLHG